MKVFQFILLHPDFEKKEIHIQVYQLHFLFVKESWKWMTQSNICFEKKLLDILFFHLFLLVGG